MPYLRIKQNNINKTIIIFLFYPIIIYNIPSRCVIDMSVDTMAKLFELKNIAGVKDATGDLNRLDQTIKKLGPEFIQLTGEDGLAFELINGKPVKLECTKKFDKNNIKFVSYSNNIKPEIQSIYDLSYVIWTK